MNETPRRPSTRWPLYLVVGLFAVVTVIFIVAFVSTTASEIAASSEPTPILTADTYMDEVTRLLENADPANGALQVEQRACIACHRNTAQENVAPQFTGIAERAASRRPPLTAAAYIYEAIINPGAFVVPGYQTAMPQNYRNLLSDRELGDIIAYLLLPDAN